MALEYLQPAAAVASVVLAIIAPIWKIRSEASKLIDKTRDLRSKKNGLFDDAIARIFLEQSIQVLKDLDNEKKDRSKYVDFWYSIRGRTSELNPEGIINTLKNAKLYDGVLSRLNLSEESKARFVRVMFARFQLYSISDACERIVTNTTRAIILTIGLAAVIILIGLVPIDPNWFLVPLVLAGGLVYAVFDSGIYQLKAVSSLERTLRKIEDAKNYDALQHALFDSAEPLNMNYRPRDF